ncbi:cyanoglobin [Rhodococcus sp. ACS1]|uniref:group III truncated hemoglobin n=1 Tax=Rhodococcus TaxID=1827 RepID=UPI000BB12790|nr:MULTISPECIES: group III truncated hemoglobin [Rhodococcus]PBC52813.1 cyanoglobin [Rhodococcus sp. ACS1]QSE83851.1 group III truncated hemoglobin [Rhodococcus koreensis]
MPDIATRADLELLLRHFYGRAFADPVLEPVFETLMVIGLDDHLPVMCDFWETILLRTGIYRGSVGAVHRALHGRHGFTDRHFDRWVELWTSSVDELFLGDVAQQAKVEAARIAVGMRLRLFEPSGGQTTGVPSRLS